MMASDYEIKWDKENGEVTIASFDDDGMPFEFMEFPTMEFIKLAARISVMKEMILQDERHPEVKPEIECPF